MEAAGGGETTRRTRRTKRRRRRRDRGRASGNELEKSKVHSDVQRQTPNDKWRSSHRLVDQRRRSCGAGTDFV